MIGQYIDAHGGSCKVYPAPFAVFLNRDETNYVEPDISVICDKDKLNEDGCSGAPDWIIEIVPPSSRQMDCYKKLIQYRTFGVREYWVVDPYKEIVTVYNFEQDIMLEYTFTEAVPSGIYDGFTIKIEQGWL